MALAWADCLVGRIEPGHRPSLLREVDGVSPLPHADVERSAWLASFDHLDQERIGLRVESRLLGRQDPVPPIDLEAPTLRFNRFQLPRPFVGRDAERTEVGVVVAQRLLLNFRRLESGPVAKPLVDLYVCR